MNQLMKIVLEAQTGHGDPSCINRLQNEIEHVLNVARAKVRETSVKYKQLNKDKPWTQTISK